jgi:hypothetical protein
MHRAVIVVVAAVLFSALVKASIAPTNPAANVTVAKSPPLTTGVISVEGVRVAVPNGVQHFPSALLPQP